MRREGRERFYRHPITQGSYDRQMYLWGSAGGGGYELTTWIAENPADMRTFDNTQVWDTTEGVK